MGFTTVPPGVPVPKRTLRGTLVGAEAFTSRSAPSLLPFKFAADAAFMFATDAAFRFALDAALPANQHSHLNKVNRAQCS